MNPYDRPPGSSRCPHKIYKTKKINKNTTQLICASCGVLAGWWTESHETVIAGKPTEYSEAELEELR